MLFDWINLNFIIVMFAITIIYLSVSERIATQVTLLAFQGVLLFVCALVELEHIDVVNFAVIISETLIFKGFIIPYYLRRIVLRNHISKTVNTVIPVYFILLIVSVALVLFYMLAFSLHDKHLDVKYFSVSIAAIFSGILMIMLHREIISHMVGYLIIENGIFLLSLAIGGEMPMLVNSAILMDILVSVLILGVFVNRLGNQFRNMDVSELSELKD